VVVKRYHVRVGDRVLDAERPGTVVTDRRVLPDRPIELVVVALFILEFGDPLRSGPVEDEFDLVAVGLGELPCGFEAVDEPAEVFVTVGSRENDDCCFRHCAPLYSPGGYTPFPDVRRPHAGEEYLYTMVVRSRYPYLV
jgi:hypothetical protein